MKQFCVLFLLAIMACSLAVAQPKNDFWPKLKKHKGPGFMGKKQFCLEGNCESGTGTSLVSDVWAENFNTKQPKVSLFLMKGIFSEGGKIFTGKIYCYASSYKEEGIGFDVDYLPVEEMNFEKHPEAFVFFAEGIFSRATQNYLDDRFYFDADCPHGFGLYSPAGEVHGYPLVNYPGASLDYGYITGFPFFMSLSQPAGSSWQKFTGFTNKYGKFLFGQLQTGDGVYCGMLNNGEPVAYGTITKSGHTRYVFTQNGNTVDADGDVFAPDSTAVKQLLQSWRHEKRTAVRNLVAWPQDNAPSFKHYFWSLIYDAKGNPANDDYTGGGFIFGNPGVFYMGMLRNGKPNGNGIFVATDKLLHDNLETGYRDFIYYGKFEESSLVKGSSIIGEAVLSKDYPKSVDTYTASIPKSLKATAFDANTELLADAESAYERGTCEVTDLFEKLANKGDADYAFRLGMIYMLGWDYRVGHTPACFGPDNTKARFWISKAAEMNSKRAFAFLGDDYSSDYTSLFGLDYEKAQLYYKKAADMGDSRSAQKLKELRQKIAFNKYQKEEESKNRVDVKFPGYDEYRLLNSSMIKVKKSGKWGLIDSLGQVIMQPRYDEITWFTEGYAAVRNGRFWGFINTKGIETVRPAYEDVANFSEGRAAVLSVRVGKALWGYIYPDGSTFLTSQFEKAYSYEKGKALVTKDGKTYEIDKNGNKLIYAGSGDGVCPMCHGSGIYSHKYEGAIYAYSITWSKTCPRCGGSGRTD